VNTKFKPKIYRINAIGEMLDPVSISFDKKNCFYTTKYRILTVT